MTVRAYYHHQLMVYCDKCSAIFDIFTTDSALRMRNGKVTGGIASCPECDNKFEFDTQYKE